MKTTNTPQAALNNFIDQLNSGETFTFDHVTLSNISPLDGSAGRYMATIEFPGLNNGEPFEGSVAIFSRDGGKSHEFMFELMKMEYSFQITRPIPAVTQLTLD